METLQINLRSRPFQAKVRRNSALPAATDRGGALGAAARERHRPHRRMGVTSPSPQHLAPVRVMAASAVAMARASVRARWMFVARAHVQRVRGMHAASAEAMATAMATAVAVPTRR